MAAGPRRLPRGPPGASCAQARPPYWGHKERANSARATALQGLVSSQARGQAWRHRRPNPPPPRAPRDSRSVSTRGAGTRPSPSQAASCTCWHLAKAAGCHAESRPASRRPALGLLLRGVPGSHRSWKARAPRLHGRCRRGHAVSGPPARAERLAPGATGTGLTGPGTGSLKPGRRQARFWRLPGCPNPRTSSASVCRRHRVPRCPGKHWAVSSWGVVAPWAAGGLPQRPPPPQASLGCRVGTGQQGLPEAWAWPQEAL